jgi:hypothetical protein
VAKDGDCVRVAQLHLRLRYHSALGEVTAGQRNTLPERREIGRQGWWESIVNNSYYAALISQN